MKHIQKIIAVAFVLFFSIGQSFAENMTIDTIDVLDTHTVSFGLSDIDSFPETDIEGEIKILRDTTIETAQRDIDNLNTIRVDLPQSLKQDTEYSLLGLFGAEGSIDFTTGRELSDVEIENDGFILEEQGIELIRIVDENTLEIVYILEVIEVEFEYKLLTELKIESISRKNATNSRVNIELRDEIELESDFIFIVVSLLDSDGNEVAFENSIYDFTSPAQLEVSIGIDGTSEDADDEFMKQLALEEKIAAKNEARQEQEQQLEQQEIPEILLENKEIVDESEEYDLSAAPTPYNLEKVATTAQVMPNTGAETWILIFSTLFINSFLYFSRRKKLA